MKSYMGTLISTPQLEKSGFVTDLATGQIIDMGTMKAIALIERKDNGASIRLFPET